MTFKANVDPYGGLDLERLIADTLFEAAIRGQVEWKRNLDRGLGAAGPHLTATGRRAGDYIDTGEARSDVTIEPAAPGSHQYSVGGDVVQLAVAEFGRAPGKMPPRDAIAAWVARQSGMPSPGDSAFEGVVFLVQRSIGAHGLPAFGPGLLAGQTTMTNLDKRLHAKIEAELEKQRL